MSPPPAPAANGCDASNIVTRPPGYAIELRPHQLDSLQFREMMEQARATLPVDPSRALEILGGALDLWRGPAFAEFADDDVARAEAARLEELRLTAVEDRVDALLALGRSADAVSVLEGVVATHPLSERPHLPGSTFRLRWCRPFGPAGPCS